MHPIALLELMKLVENLDVDEGAKRQFKRAVRQVGEAHGAGEMEHGDRVEFACHLLRQREARSVIRQRLMDAFRVSRRQAYRDIDEALQLCHLNGTKQAETTTNEEAITQE